MILKKVSGTVWSLFLLYGLLNKMKLLKTVPAALMLAGGVFAAMNATADDSVFTVMDDPTAAKKPFEGNLNAGYLAQSGNTKSSSLTADSTLTWYGNTTAWSLWGNASNTSASSFRDSNFSDDCYNGACAAHPLNDRVKYMSNTFSTTHLQAFHDANYGTPSTCISGGSAIGPYTFGNPVGISSFKSC